jgi:hypothetical protein
MERTKKILQIISPQTPFFPLFLGKKRHIQILHTELKTEGRTDEAMDTLIQHPMVREAIKEAAKELWEQGNMKKLLQFP